MEALDGSGYRAVQQRHASVVTPAADTAKLPLFFALLFTVAQAGIELSMTQLGSAKYSISDWVICCIGR